MYETSKCNVAIAESVADNNREECKVTSDGVE